MELVDYLKRGPKNRLEDFYDYRDLVDKLRISFNLSTVSVVLGVRRIGKTSLVLSTVYDFMKNRKDVLFFHIDLRGVTSRDQMNSIILRSHIIGAKSLEYKSPLLKEFDKRLKDKLTEIISSTTREASLKIIKFSKTLSRRLREAGYTGLRDYLELYDDLCSELNARCIMFFDEIHEPALYIKNGFKREIAGSLAYACDYLRNLKIVVSGSLVRLTEEIINQDPLVGRLTYIELKELDMIQVRDFLEKALKPYIKQDLVRVIPTLSSVVVYPITNGIIGWITLFGQYLVENIGSMELSKALTVSIRSLITDMYKTGLEQVNVLRRYLREPDKAIKTLYLICKGVNSWSELKNVTSYSDGVLSSIIEKLERYGLVKKVADKYYPCDPSISVTLGAIDIGEITNRLEQFIQAINLIESSRSG